MLQVHLKGFACNRALHVFTDFVKATKMAYSR